MTTLQISPILGISNELSNDQENYRDNITGLPKGELHVHINGAIPASIIQKILNDEATSLPPEFLFERDMVRKSPCHSLADYLIPWRILRLFPKTYQNLELLTLAVTESLAKNNVRFVELRSSVLYLAHLQNCSPAQALERLITSTEKAAQHYGIRRGLILTVTRHNQSAAHLSTLLQAYKDLGEPKEVVGLDLAGDEDIAYPAELPSLFCKAKDQFGLGVTIHAGETGHIENIRTAVELFNADRIGHGTAAGQDASIMELLAKKQICVEVCPISNRLTRAVPQGKAHPLPLFLQYGVPFVICSDNPEIHQQGLINDYMAALDEGLSLYDIEQQYQISKNHSFIKGLD
ncbi:MAG: adenosine deaminase family protein [Paenalcaligenes sp.]